jgi:hypothetical protein
MRVLGFIERDVAATGAAARTALAGGITKLAVERV